MNAIFEIIDPTGTLTFANPKIRAIAHAVGHNEGMVYSALLSKFRYYSERGMLDEGWFYSTAQDLEETTVLTAKQQKLAIANLVKAGLILSKLRGMPAKRNFYIIEDKDTLIQLIAAGEAKISEKRDAKRYEKKRSAVDDSFMSKGEKTVAVSPAEFEEYSLPGCRSESAEQASTKGKTLLCPKGEASFAQNAMQHFIKTKHNKPRQINQSFTHKRVSDEMDTIDFSERENYFSALKKNISYADLCESRPDDKSCIDEILALMTEVICSEKSTVRANGENQPQQLVKSVFLKLNRAHIEYVLDAMRDNSAQIRNIRAYLITVLYNTPTTISSYYAACNSKNKSAQISCAMPAKLSKTRSASLPRVGSPSFDTDELKKRVLARYTADDNNRESLDGDEMKRRILAKYAQA